MVKLDFSNTLDKCWSDPYYKKFATHLNYIKCMGHLTADMRIDYNVRVNGGLELLREFLRFENLASKTKKVIEYEEQICNEDETYSQIAALWIPAKCYYRLYYLESIFCYLIEGSAIGFRNGGHKGIRKTMRTLIREGKISGSADSSELFRVVSCIDATKFTACPGANLSLMYHQEDTCIKSLRKKLSKYMNEDKKKKKRTDRKDKRKQKKNNEICLLDFFYLMRIKTNYRDADFLTFESPYAPRDALEYNTCYIQAYRNYASALEDVISRLKISRGMS